MNFRIIDALKQIETEKGLSLDTVLEALKDALLSAYKKNYRVAGEARIDMDTESGEIKVFETVEKPDGESEEMEVTPENFGRIAAQTAKQVIIQRIREAERELMYEEYSGREGDIVTGIIQQNDQRYTLVDLGKVEALLPPSEQVKGEHYQHGARVKTYIVDVRRSTKGPQIMVSRTHPGLLKCLLELEVPEIRDGLVEIKAVAREAGQRSKVAVSSNDPNIDPVGACVGAKGSRVRMVVNELRGEKVDIVEWKEDPAEFVANAISPARVSQVVVDEANGNAEVTVPDNQLSLAIGKEGQNARLSAKLTGWRIDILSESQALEAEALAAEEAETVPEEEAAVSVKEEAEHCQAITSSGERCRNKAKPGSRYCGIPAHKKLAESEEGEAETGVETEKEVADTDSQDLDVVEESPDEEVSDEEAGSIEDRAESREEEPGAVKDTEVAKDEVGEDEGSDDDNKEEKDNEQEDVHDEGDTREDESLEVDELATESDDKRDV